MWDNKKGHVLGTECKAKQIQGRMECHVRGGPIYVRAA